MLQAMSLFDRVFDADPTGDATHFPRLLETPSRAANDGLKYKHKQRCQAFGEWFFSETSCAPLAIEVPYDVWCLIASHLTRSDVAPYFFLANHAASSHLNATISAPAPSDSALTSADLIGPLGHEVDVVIRWNSPYGRVLKQLSNVTTDITGKDLLQMVEKEALECAHTLRANSSKSDLPDQYGN